LAAEGFESHSKDTLPVEIGSSSVLAELKQTWEKVSMNIFFEDGMVDPDAAVRIGPKDGPKVRIGFDGTIMKPGISDAGLSYSSQRGAERVSTESIFSNETVTLSIVRRPGEVAVLTEEGKLLFSSDAWENKVVQVEIMKAAAADSESSENSFIGTNDADNTKEQVMQVSELLLLRGSSTFKEFN
ncbi:MAG: hypothetical protein K9M94_13595, partial [Spirochaetia bacterium]|nr:hypothetical protein [Spirochaetia bacterium]